MHISRNCLRILYIICMYVPPPVSQTCSHGAACNFIHCFRNPGGDYEWSDWDNPPPKYWIRKMIALFGLSADTKLCDTPDLEWSQGSDRKRLKSSADRYIHALTSNYLTCTFLLSLSMG
jgi:hypothetical protein